MELEAPGHGGRNKNTLLTKHGTNTIAGTDQLPDSQASRMDTMRFPLTDLPPEIIVRVCLYHPFRMIRQLRTILWRLYWAITTKSLWKSVDLPGEELDRYILGLLLTGPTRYLDVSRTIRGEEMEVQNLIHQLETQQSRLEGLCLSGWRGPDVTIAKITALLPKLKVLDIAYSRYDLVHAVICGLPDNCGITYSEYWHCTIHTTRVLDHHVVTQDGGVNHS